jgi:hypothetical protein
LEAGGREERAVGGDQARVAGAAASDMNGFNLDGKDHAGPVGDDERRLQRQERKEHPIRASVDGLAGKSFYFTAKAHRRTDLKQF